MCPAEPMKQGRPEPDLDAAIVDLVSRGAVKVPPYPAVAMRVNELVRRDDFGLDELSKLVASDQALTADTLRAANSAFYSRGTPVASLSGAISRIGAKEVVRLALASGLGTHARAPGPLAALKRRVWLEALGSAALAQELAKGRNLSPEEAFVCGLLHDFGKMIGIACVEEIVRAHPGFRPRPLEEWVGVVERYHVELGLVLAAQWELPAVVSDVVSRHHSEDAAGAVEPRLVELVAATDEVVALISGRTWVSREDLGAISALGAAECELVFRVLERLPAFIASFEGAGPAPADEPSLIEPESADHFLTGPTPVEFAVTVVANRETRSYRAMAIAPTNLMVTGPKPLPENVLMELKLASTPPLTCWATAKLSWPEGGGHAVLLQPFALNGTAQAAWKELVRKTTSDAAGEVAPDEAAAQPAPPPPPPGAAPGRDRAELRQAAHADRGHRPG
ncbi:MAG TPA: HDOD domain-containing protein [Anaeromyxobacteraceae bacterium]|nr:HDOD domain-containing protein [Anaeromyxobacteraceae bacterium]